jgi:hypothetical protein
MRRAGLRTAPRMPPCVADGSKLNIRAPPHGKTRHNVSNSASTVLCSTLVGSRSGAGRIFQQSLGSITATPIDGEGVASFPWAGSGFGGSSGRRHAALWEARLRAKAGGAALMRIRPIARARFQTAWMKLHTTELSMCVCLPRIWLTSYKRRRKRRAPCLKALPRSAVPSVTRARWSRGGEMSSRPASRC